MKKYVQAFLKQIRRQDGFRGPVLTLLSGSSVALLLAYLAQPILTRLYTPEAFGLADYFTSLVVVLMTVASFRYEDALMQPEDEKEAGAVWWLAISLLVLFTCICALLLPWRTEIADLFGIPKLAPWLFFVPPTLLAMRVWKLTEVWLTRFRRFHMLPVGQVSNTATMIVSRIGAGVREYGAGGLIGGFFLGHFAGAVILTVASIRMTGSVLKESFQPRLWITMAQRYRRYALFSMPSTLLGSLLSRLPFLLIPFFFNEAVLGFFGRSFLALAVPLSFIGTAIAQVFFVQASESHRIGKLHELTETVHARLVMLGLYPTLVVMLVGGDLFEVVFGSTWRPAGDYLRYLAPWLFLAAVSSPLTRLFDVLERQRLDLLSSAAIFVVLLVALVWSGKQGDVLLLLRTLGIAGVTTRVFHLLILLYLAEVPYRDAAKTYVRYLLIALPGLLLLVPTFFVGIPLFTVGMAFLSGVTYGIMILWKDDLITDP